jgi:trehalose/maltose hydrolase-like predicted phosphorylase
MFLQSLVFGYGGLRFNDNGISMDPLLPPGVTAMKLRGLNYADAVRQQTVVFVEARCDNSDHLPRQARDKHEETQTKNRFVLTYCRNLTWRSAERARVL